MPNIEDILKAAKPRERTVRVCVRGDLASEAERLAAELAQVSQEWEPSSLVDEHPGRRIAADLRTAQTAAKAAEEPFVLRFIGDQAYSDLLAAHPSDNERELFDDRTFPTALIVASCVDPKMTPEQAAALFEIVNKGEQKRLFDAAWEVNNDAAADASPFSLAASALLAGLGGEK
ncbi:hypothetical protein [Streptomyces sp. AK08-02]|uniref:hypothetical protein n=1 Tax=Streptomyces sp. AK08-02 TaxID=3028654 RepID=UPI0029A3F4F5|nr:hypothetical protein [Streptomyces sp. AK08-02]MDX3746697.1 hypothetical protein [Streptomyces sp. AK08-02]